MELRRFNVFLFSSIGSRIRFISELEFEDGAEEIALETALVDFIVNPSFVVRAGVLLPPVGAFNVNHDSPRWDFIDRPLVSTEVIPATLSEVGFGAHGRLFPRGFTVTYDAYLTNGLGDGVILNDAGRTRLASGKGTGLVAGDNNGRPAVSGRLGFSGGTSASWASRTTAGPTTPSGWKGWTLTPSDRYGWPLWTSTPRSFGSACGGSSPLPG